MYKAVHLPAVLYVCETWSLTLGEEHRLKVSENRVLRRISEPKRHGEKCKMGNLIILTVHHIPLGSSKQEGEMNRARSTQEGREKCIQCFRLKM
jgi:hypothetical protein